MQRQKSNSKITQPQFATVGTMVLSGLMASALLGGCRVGPKYVAPKTPAPPAFKETSQAAYKNLPPGTWQPAKPGDAMLKGKWWEVFNEPELNALEEQLDINNQNVARYFQNFMAARAIVREARSQLWPAVTVGAGVGRSRSASGNGAASTGTSLQFPLGISWEPDLFGRVRNQITANQAAAQVSAADLENERLSEQASLAQYYFELRGQDALQQVLDHTVDADRKQVELTRTLVDTGIDSPETLAQAEVTLANAEQAQVGIGQNRAIYEHALATLIGKSASQFSMPVKPLTTPIPDIPIGVPSQVLERRPDIASAERTMAQANALIGVQQAAFYPLVDLTAGGGLESGHIANLFSSSALFWSLGASASETIFDAGLRRATVDQYKAQYNADAAAYKQTVLTAFQQVEDGLSSLRVTSAQRIKQEDAVKAAQRYYDIANTRFHLGLDPYLNVITAEDTLLNDQQTQVTLHVNAMVASVQLVQALGGGWDRSQLPSGVSITTAAAETQVRNTQ